MYIGGMGVRKAHDKALHYFTLSAHQGHTLALYNLGQMHLNGLGTVRSCPVGAQFLKAVAERGPWGQLLEEAHAELQSGKVEVPLQLYAVLAEGGFELAQANVAFLLDELYTSPTSTPTFGMGVEALAESAATFYKLAAQQVPHLDCSNPRCSRPPSFSLALLRLHHVAWAPACRFSGQH